MASLRITRKDLLTHKTDMIKYKCFKSDKEVLDYSWELFRDKMN